ncbi:MAG: AAA family ATPase [Alphaproteobacteria bacterium]|nr:AAA family ATPase [Alphaproteobacteria bacterium]
MALTPRPVPLSPSGAPALDPTLWAWLLAGADGKGPCERVIETSISLVFLFEDRVLKLKKPVDYDFVDFSTPAKRQAALERELRINRPQAPHIYRRVWRIRRDPAAGWRLAALDDDDDPSAEAALEMARFPAGALLSAQTAVDGPLGEALGREIARFHLTAPLAPEGGGADGLDYVLTSNALQLRHYSEALGAARVEALIAGARTALEALTPALNARRAGGFCRACHGDLHTDNIVVETADVAGGEASDGRARIVLIDAIEFNDRLREIDILYDLAFPLMDLTFRGQGEAANRLLNGWLDAAARAFGPELYSGLSLLPLFLSTRAAVRAHVRAREGRMAEARAYLDAALAHLSPGAPSLLAVGGAQGSGKTTRARSLAPGFGAAPGAVILRSDEIRKRLAGCGPFERLPPQAYTPALSDQVYQALFDAAQACLAAGRTVIADAVFYAPERRLGIEAVARRANLPFEGLWLEVPRPVALARLAGRTGDASDADAAVLEAQLRQDPGPVAWRRDRAGGETG